MYEALAEKLAVQDVQAICERDRPELAFWGFEAELACPSDVAHPYRVTRSRLLVLGVANLLAEVRPSEEVRAQLEALLLPICYPGGLQEPPAFELLTQRTTLKNGLDSFLGSCESDALAATIGAQSAEPFSDAIISGNIVEILERIDADANTTEQWLSLVPFLVGAPGVRRPRRTPCEGVHKASADRIGVPRRERTLLDRGAVVRAGLLYS